MRAHYLAFRLLLTAIPNLSDKVFSAIRKSSGTPVRANYVVLFPDGPADLGDDRWMALQRVGSRSRWRYDVRVVAVDADGLLLIADAVSSVIGKVPVVSGRKCESVRLVPGVEEGKAQHDAVSDLFFMDFSFEFWSQEA